VSASRSAMHVPSLEAGTGLGRRIASLVNAGTVRFVLMLASAAMLVGSIFLPYWHITLHAPQYPKGLYIDVFVNKMEPYRNVFEVDGLNHYIGMIKLTDAATLERAISVYAIPFVALLLLASFRFSGAWRWVLRLPAIVYPVVFVADLFAWLYYAGHSLDEKAPMSSSISEFTPRLLGEGTIGQFRTVASFEPGFYLAVGAAVVALAVTIWERQARHARRG
jgi:copper chaperone NosL